MRNLRDILMFVVLAISSIHISSCKINSVTDSANQSPDTGLAQYVFYQCTTATTTGGIKKTFSTSAFNNLSPEISIQIDTSNSKTLEFTELTKVGANRWLGSSGLSVTLTNKKNDAKGIHLAKLDKTLVAGTENSFCQIICAGPTILANGQCLWTGITEESVIGNMIIETVATAGLSNIWRLGTLGRLGSSAIQKQAQTVFLVDAKFRTGAQSIAKARNYDEAVARLSKSIEKTNPLSGTKAVGGGNCANDAMTQLVSMVLGRWACAIPYPKGKSPYTTSDAILADLQRLVGIKSIHAHIGNLGLFAQITLARQMAEGDIAFLLSGARNAGHATLITKIKGQLVHINNQNWPQRFQKVAEWEKTWRETFGQEDAYFQLYIISKKMIGFE